MSIRKITQRTPRAFSGWFIIGPRSFDYCCDCGLAHENQHRIVVDEKRKRVTVYMRSRRAIGRTKKRRTQRNLFERKR